MNIIRFGIILRMLPAGATWREFHILNRVLKP